MRLADLKGRSVAVWGSGPEGRAAIRAIVTQAPSRLIAVDDSAGFLGVPWDDEPVPLAGGDHAYPALVTAEVVVRTADVPLSHPWLAELGVRGVAVTTGSSLWMVDHAAQAVVVTGDGRSATAGLLAHLFAALGRSVSSGRVLLGLPAAGEYVVELSPDQCAGLVRSPRVAVLTSSDDDSVLELLRHGPELIVVDGTDLRLRDAIRGITDINGFPPVPVAAEDSRFRVEQGQVFCSDEPLFPREALGPADEGAGRALCVALAVLDGVGVDVPGVRDEIRAALGSFEPERATTAR